MTNSSTRPEPCKGCGFHYQCICHLIPRLDTSWYIALLTHPNELNRDTNTGKLLSQTLTNCQIHIWDRVNPPLSLLEQLKSGDYQPYLLFPTDESTTLTEFSHHSESSLTPLFIILDGTWQEAKKMLNKSPWLQGIPSVHLKGDFSSEYQLRRNQKQGNLCTYEVGAELINIFNGEIESEKVRKFFNYYLSVFNADKSGHKYNP